MRVRPIAVDGADELPPLVFFTCVAYDWVLVRAKVQIIQRVNWMFVASCSMLDGPCRTVAGTPTTLRKVGIMSIGAMQTRFVRSK